MNTLADGPYEAGTHRVLFDAGRLPSGLYLVQARVRPAGGRLHLLTQKVTLMK